LEGGVERILGERAEKEDKEGKEKYQDIGRLGVRLG
jgi:hypothetical protein